MTTRDALEALALKWDREAGLPLVVPESAASIRLCANDLRAALSAPPPDLTIEQLKETP